MTRARSLALGAALLAGALLAGACANSQVTPIGVRRPSRPQGCALDLYPTTSPPYPYTPIAKVRTECDPVRRHTCVEQLRTEACLAGADGIVGFKESTRELSMFIDATLIVKGLAGPDVPVGSAANACEPICSPGFACQGGQCIPQCNPPCEAGEICSRKRLCEPPPTVVPKE